MPILLSKDEWSRIVKWTDENKEDPEAVRLREYLKDLSKKSAEITKSWPNSLENVNKRNEDMRRARIESHEHANAKFYKRYVKRKKEEQERMMYSARDTIFKNKDAPKLLLNAVVESVILKEREEQIKFSKEYVGAYQREQDRLNDEMIMRKAKEWNDMQEEKKRRRFQVNKEHQRDLLEQIRTSEERNRKEYEEELRLQREDIANSNKEMQAIKDFEAKFKEAEKQRIWKDNKQSMLETKQRMKEQAARDLMDDQLLEVLKKSHCRIEAKRKATELELRNEKLRILEAVTKRVQNTTGARDAKEQACLEKAIAEGNARVEARHKAYVDKVERFRREKIEAREEFLREQARRLHKEHTIQQWGLMNRFKNEEVYEEYKENLRKEKERKTKQYREDILKQKKEVDERNAKELADTRYYYGQLAEQKFRDADNKLLTHSLALLDEARRNGRPTLPIEKAIARYCKMYRLYPMPELPKTLQSHFPTYAPVDGSAPDPGYSEPPRPPPATDPDVFEDDEPDTPEEKRAGLQSLVKMQTMAQKAPKPKTGPAAAKRPDAPVEDYKRQGPANGLQRRAEPPEEIVLPPITVVTYPCKKLGIVSNVPLKKNECKCVVVGEI